jgi:hypothetical protein
MNLIPFASSPLASASLRTAGLNLQPYAPDWKKSDPNPAGNVTAAAQNRPAVNAEALAEAEAYLTNAGFVKNAEGRWVKPAAAPAPAAAASAHEAPPKKAESASVFGVHRVAASIKIPGSPAKAEAAPRPAANNISARQEFTAGVRRVAAAFKMPG